VVFAALGFKDFRADLVAVDLAGWVRGPGEEEERTARGLRAARPAALLQPPPLHTTVSLLFASGPGRQLSEREGFAWRCQCETMPGGSRV